MSNSHYGKRLSFRRFFPFINNSYYYQYGEDEGKQERANFNLIGGFIQLLTKGS